MTRERARELLRQRQMFGTLRPEQRREVLEDFAIRYAAPLLLLYAAACLLLGAGVCLWWYS